MTVRTITCGLLKARQNLSISFFEFYQIVLILSDPLQVKVLEQQLEQEHEERISFLRERHELEGKIMGLQVNNDQDDFLWDVSSDAGS